jgi:hypothetical protein
MRHVRQMHGSLPPESQLRDWYKGSYSQIVNTKKSYMDKEAFKEIVAEFPSEFVSLNDLAEKIREILFPIRNGSLFTGAYHDPDRLYKPMADAFERAVADFEEARLESC